MTILVTGFEVFNGLERNPSWEAAKLLPPEIDGVKIEIAQIPVVFGEAGAAMDEHIRRTGADAVLCVGVAVGRTAVTPELVAINYRTASIADNSGRRITGEKINPALDAAYMTDMPIHDIIDDIKAAGIPAALSLSAGAYVCNDLYFHLLSLGRQGLFVHVPGEDAVSAEDDARALTLCLRRMIHCMKGHTAEE